MNRGKGLLEKITHETRWKYREARKRERSELLKRFFEVTGYSRKHAGRVLRGRSKRKERPKKRGSRGIYRYPEFTLTLKKFWLSTDQMCGRNLKVAMPIRLPLFEQEHGSIADRVKKDLLGVSHSKIDRIIHPYGSQHPKERGGTKPGTLLRTQIPIRTDFWDVDRPGETDWVE